MYTLRVIVKDTCLDWVLGTLVIIANSECESKAGYLLALHAEIVAHKVPAKEMMTDNSRWVDNISDKK